MNPDERLDKIFSDARAAAPDIGKVEAGFETRLMARIREELAKGERPWFSLAWRLVPVFMAVTVSLGVWYYASVPDNPVDMRSMITAEYDDSMSMNFLNGG